MTHRSPATASPGPSPRDRVGYLVGAFLMAAGITLVWLGMRAVMDMGGACASGGAYEIATPCPGGVGLVMILAFPMGFVGLGIVVWTGVRLGGPWPALAALAWPALFLSLGWNVVEYGLFPPFGGGPELGWLVPGVVFLLMGGIPLWLFVAARGDAPIVPGVPGTRARSEVRQLRDLRDAMARAARAAHAGAGPDAGTMTVWQATHRRRSSPRQQAVPVTPAAVSTSPPASVAGASVVGGSVAAGSTTPVHPAPDAGEVLVGQLERLARLHREGSLSILEFQAAKAALLSGAQAPDR